MRNDEKQTNSDAVLLRIEGVMKDKGISQRKLIQSLNLNPSSFTQWRYGNGRSYDAIDKRVLRRSLLSLENLNCQVIVSRSGIVGQFQIRVDIPVERLLPLSYHDSPNQRIGSGIREIPVTPEAQTVCRV